jgi:hypothetical protein
MLPYGFAAAAKLKGAKPVLTMHDLYPDVLVMAGLLKPQSMLAKAMRALNALMFRALDAVVIIGRDTEKLLPRYRGMSHEKIRFIPNWATLEPGIRAIAPDNPYRQALSARFVAGLSGSVLPMIPLSYSRRRACSATIAISASCCRAGGSG